MSDEKRASEDTGYEDQRMVEKATEWHEAALEVTAALGSYVLGETNAGQFASALRLIAEKLSPDTEKRALEIAANLGMLVLPFADKLPVELRVDFANCVLGTLACGYDTSTWSPERFAGVQADIARIEGMTKGPPRHWLQQARDFFEQAEETAKEEG